MIEVSKEQFFAAMNPLNVHPQIQPGPYPYTKLWELPNREVVGRSVDYIPEGEALTRTRYYLARTD